MILHCKLLVLLLCVGGALTNPVCRNRLDIVIAVDTTSSLADTSFEDVKAQVKEIVTGFTIGQEHTRLALISITNQASVIANFDAVNSVADFNAAVDRLTFSTEKARLSEGIRVAKDSVLNNARTVKTVTALILVKDRRLERVADSAELSGMAAETAGVKSSGASIHAIGVGGLWNRLELQALFGTEYLLFKNKNALQSAKSLNNRICDASCPRKGSTSKKEGLCYGASKHVLSSKVELATNSAGQSVCRTEIDRTFAPCVEKQDCNQQSRDVSKCGSDGKVTVKSAWQMFDRRTQSCTTMESSRTVDCADSWKCEGQVADVIFLLDKSGSLLFRFVKNNTLGNNFPSIKQATIVLAESLNIGPDNVRVGILKFGLEPETIIPFGSINDRSTFMQTLNDMNTTVIQLEGTGTSKGLAAIRSIFAKEGRKDVAKFVIVMTDGLSDDELETKREADLLKKAGVTIIAIGVAVKRQSEIAMLAAPEASNMINLKDFKQLSTWSKDFAQNLCLRLAAPEPKLCDDGVFYQTVSECENGKQRVTKTEFKYNDSKKCFKIIQITEHVTCKQKCTCPIDGNEYLEGDTWTILCHEFKCIGSYAKPFGPAKSKCPAANGDCNDIGSTKFKCFNDLGVATDNCQCVNRDGRAVVVMDTL